MLCYLSTSLPALLVLHTMPLQLVALRDNPNDRTKANMMFPLRSLKEKSLNFCSP